VSFFVDVTQKNISREKSRARELRRTQWWKRNLEKGLCHYCGGCFSSEHLTMDHVVPIIRGGKSTRANCVPACKECNSRKKHLLPVEWEEYLVRLDHTSASLDY